MAISEGRILDSEDIIKYLVTNITVPLERLEEIAKED